MTGQRVSLLVVSLVSSFVLAACTPQSSSVPQPNQTPTQASQVANAIVRLDFADLQATYSAEITTNQTVLEMLQNVAQENNHEVVVKEYSFGTLVESIDGKANSPERAWIYFVNGQAANAGADQQQVAPGDVIEWRYMKPTEQ